MKTKRLQIRLDPARADALARYAKKANRTATSLIEHFIDMLIEDEKFQKQSEKLAVDAEQI